MSEFIFSFCMGMVAMRLFLLGEYLYCIAVIIAYIATSIKEWMDK